MAFVESTRSQLPTVRDTGVIGPPGSNAQPAPADFDEMEEGEHEEPEREPVPEEKYGSAKERLLHWIDDHNIARHLDGATLGMIGTLVVNEFELDDQTRQEWKKEAEGALKFATQDSEAKQYPWPNASNVIFPLITQAAFQFSSMSYPALIDGRSVARGAIWGDDEGTPATTDSNPEGAPQMHPDGGPMWLIPPGEKAKRAARVGEHMSFQLLNEMKEWEPETDTLLMQLPIVGGALRKTYRDETTGMNCSVLVPLLNLVWNKNAPSFEKAPRLTELITYYPHEIEELERADETFLKLVYGPGDGDPEAGNQGDTLAPYEFLEQHRRYDLDNDGYPEPLIITVHRRTARVVRIVARYDADAIVENDEKAIQKIEPVDYYTLYRFLPNPKGGSYPVGFGHLLKPLNEAINTTLNQMFDAGHLQIAGGGFVGTGLSIHTGAVNFQMGEYKPVNAKGGAIRDSVYTIPFPGPSQVLFQLLGTLISAAKEVASIQNILSGDPGLANVQPTTLLALIKQGMRLYTAIYKRVYRSLESELKKLHRLNRLYLDKKTRFKVQDSWREVTRDDYRLGGGVEPAADPNMVTDMEKLGMAMVLWELKDDPFIEPLEIRKRLIYAVRAEKPDKLLRPAPPPDPNKQLEQANMQADLGRKRAQEQKDGTQAYLNLALARKAAGEASAGWIDQQIKAIQTHLEALNTTIKAADVDAKFYGHNVRMKMTGDEAREAAHESARAAGASQPDGTGNNGPGSGDVEAAPGNSMLPVMAGTPRGQLPLGTSAQVGVQQAA